MIIDKEVEIEINPANMKILIEKGYEIPTYYNSRKNKFAVKKGTKIKIIVTDLSHGSWALVNTSCDYCLKKKQQPYRQYLKSLNTNEHIKKYCCEECDHLKKREIYEYKQTNGLLKRGDKGYWTFKENRMKELDNYIKEYGTITNIQMDKIGACIVTSIRDNGESLESCCLELGYNLVDIKKRHVSPPHYYEDFNNLKNGILGIIDILGRFPKQQEVLRYLHISNNYLLNFGGIREIKKKMGFCDENDLIDDRGVKNASVYEYMTAQYLIGNSISYKREQHPFKGKYSNFRSDFTFYLKNNEQIHVEVWGFSRKDDNSERSKIYNQKRILKEKLYKDNNYILIDIDYEIFQGKYEDIQKRLYEMFSPYLQLDFKIVNQEKFIPSNKLSDIEILNEIMRFSDNEKILPRQDVLKEKGMSNLINEVIKRYDTYYNFAKKFGKNYHRKRNAWNKNTIFNTFDYMISKYGYILGNEEIKRIKDETIKGIIEGSQKVFESLLEAKLCYFEHLIDNCIKISELDLKYIDKALHIRKGFNRKCITEDRLIRLRIIMEKATYKN